MNDHMGGTKTCLYNRTELMNGESLCLVSQFYRVLISGINSCPLAAIKIYSTIEHNEEITITP